MVGNFKECGSAPPAITPALIFFTSCSVKLDAVDTDIVGSSPVVGKVVGPTATARELTVDTTRAVIASEVLHRTRLTVVDEWLPRSVVGRTTVEIL